MKKRIFAVLLCFCLLVGLMPTAAFAADTDTGKAILPGTGGISGWDSADGYDYIYFGNWTVPDSYTTSGPIKWRVLDDQTNTGGAGLFLLSDVAFGTGLFGDDIYYDSSGNSNAWQGSDAQAWCKDFAGEAGAATKVTDAFTGGELGAVLAATKSDRAFTSSTKSVRFSASENILNGDKVFFLSAEEAENEAYGFTNDAARVANYGSITGAQWWLRSAIGNYTYYAGVVKSGNSYVDVDKVYNGCAARPAFNLNLNAVLFTSAADNSGHISFGTDIPDYNGSEWKVTLKDGNDFSGGASVVSGTTSFRAGATLTINHVALSSLSNEYTDVTDASGTLRYYGSINSDTSATKSTVTIPADLPEAAYTLSFYGEDRNEANRTDYATRTPYTVTITVDNTPPGLSALVDGSVRRTRDTDATVRFTSYEAGTYYYAVVDKGKDAPDIDTTGAGTPCYAKKEQTISLTTLTAGAKDIYIVAKDAAGNVSDPLILEIPAYLVQETTPNAGFNATGDNCGTLSNADTSMKYSVDGGNTWNDITGETMEITGVTTENGIKIYKQGNGTTTFDSEKQTIDVTQAPQPTGIDKSDCTTSLQNDGQITGVDTTMEYRLSGDSDWTAVTGNTVTGLTNGTYEVRVKASGTILASSAAIATIGAHSLSLTAKVEGTCIADGKEAYYICEVCGKNFEDEAGNTEITSLNEWGIIPAAGHEAGTVWKSDENGHWNECVNCGDKMNEAAHTYEWVTDKEPTATEAGSRNEKCKICGYAKAAVEIPTTGTAEKPYEPSKPSETPSEPSKDTNTPAGDVLTVGVTVADTASGAVYRITTSGVSGVATAEYVKPTKSKKTSAVIPDAITVNGASCRVTSIAANAFKNNKYLKKVTVGSNILMIGNNAFYNCKKLKTVSGGANLGVIETKAFAKCAALTKITLPATVMKIGKQAFYNCSRLKNITIKTTQLTAKNVGTKAFKGTYAKAKVKVPKRRVAAYKKLLKAKGISSKAAIKK